MGDPEKPYATLELRGKHPNSNEETKQYVPKTTVALRTVPKQYSRLRDGIPLQ